MYECSVCSNTFTRKDSLKRHIQTKHDEKDKWPKRTWAEQHEEAMKETRPEYDELKKNYESAEEVDQSSEDSDCESEPIWDDMIKDVYLQTDKRFDEIAEELRMRGMDEEKVQNAAKLEMLDIHEKLLKKTFMRVLVVAHDLKQTNIFDEVKKEMCRLRKRKVHDAFRKAVDKNTSFRELLEIDAQEDDEEGLAWQKKMTLFADSVLCE